MGVYDCEKCGAGPGFCECNATGSAPSKMEMRACPFCDSEHDGNSCMEAHREREARAASTSANVAQGAHHPDDVAVDRFAAAMKDKLAAPRAKGRSGWQQSDPTELSVMLREHVEKGDPRDVANFCMFLWNLGHPISDAALPMGRRAAAPPARTSLADDALFEDDYERDEFLQACRDFEGTGETAVDYWLLMKWADAGLLECEHFTVTAAGNAEIARTDAATAAADRQIQSPNDA